MFGLAAHGVGKHPGVAKLQVNGPTAPASRAKLRHAVGLSASSAVRAPVRRVLHPGTLLI